MSRRSSPPAGAAVAVLGSLSVLAASPALQAQDAAEILNRAAQVRASQWSFVDDYTVDQTAAGNRVLLYYEKVPGTEAFRMVPLSEIAREEAGYTKEEVALMAEGMAMGMGLVGPAVAAQQPGPLGLEILNMTGEMQYFLNAAATAARTEDDNSDDARQAEADRASFAEVARLVGRETVDGAETFHLRADGLELVQTTEEGTTFTLESADVYMDAELYLPRRTVFRGTLEADGRSSPLTIETLEQDLRPAGQTGGLMVPHRRVLRLDGIFGSGLSAEEQAEMEEARRKMAELKEQLAALPPDQQEMIRERLAPQIAQMEQMMSGGALEAVVTINEIKVNAGPPSQEDMARVMVPGQP